MASSPKTISIIDVAEEAGVSKSTVSRVLMGQSGVSKASQLKVQDAADRLGYVRDMRAHSLRQTSISIVPILVRSVRLSFYGELVADLQHQLESYGLRAAINTQEPLETPQRALKRLLEYRPEGVIITSGQIPMEEIEKYASMTPFVQIGRSSDSKLISSFSDDHSGTSFIARELRRLGHHNVVLMNPKPGLSDSLAQRIVAFEAALDHEGIGVIRVGIDKDYRPDLNHLHEVLDKATCIVCPNDPVLMEVWETLRDWGLSVPGDISLTGYDGVGQLASPVIGITTWRQPLAEMAEAAARHLSAVIEDPDMPVVHETFHGEFIRGRTLGKANH